MGGGGSSLKKKKKIIQRDFCLSIACFLSYYNTFSFILEKKVNSKMKNTILRHTYLATMW